VVAAYSRIYFTAQDKKRVLRDMLRELLVIANDWNKNLGDLGA